MTTTPMARHVCQCCGRSGTREFVSVGNGRWECADGTACRRRSIQAARREKAARAPLAELPTLLGGGTVEMYGDKAWFEIDTAGYREAVLVEYHADEEHPFRVWVRSWGPGHQLTRELEGGTFDTSAEAAEQVSKILAAIARSEELLADLPQNSFPECKGSDLSSRPHVTDVERNEKPRSWPTG